MTPDVETRARHAGQIYPAAVAMTVAVFVIGSLLAWQILTNPGVANLQSRGGALAPAAPSPLLTGDAAVGRRLADARCAGCHTADGRLVGPSWRSVAMRYDPASGVPADDCLPRLVSAVGHPKPGWDGYPPGPEMAMSLEERAALASFILTFSRGAPASSPGPRS